MAGIPSQLLDDLRRLLAECDEFQTNRSLRALFIDQRISPWRNEFPEFETLSGRVDGVISCLHSKKHRNGSNVLVLMLDVLREHINPDDSRHEALKTLASRVAEILNPNPPKPVKLEHSEEKQVLISTVEIDNVGRGDLGTAVQRECPSSPERLNATSVDEEKKDFFISYTGNDRKWAEWIAWQLEHVGYSTIIQAWDFRPGKNFVGDMQDAMTHSERTIAVLSPDYLSSRFTQPEWNAAFALDPTGEMGLLLPVRVRECELKGLLPQIVYIDLVGLSADDAVEVLLDGVKRGRRKPAISPHFPSTQSSKRHA